MAEKLWFHLALGASACALITGTALLSGLLWRTGSPEPCRDEVVYDHLAGTGGDVVCTPGAQVDWKVATGKDMHWLIVSCRCSREQTSEDGGIDASADGAHGDASGE
jgi:hypothetical protein